MPQDRSDRRLTFGFLCVSPFLVFIVVCVRALRIPGVYQGIAAVLVTAMTVAAWTLGARAIGADTKERQWLALSGGLLVVPWSVLALVFPGLGVPQQATEAENQLRYLALLLAGILMTGGFVTLTETLREAGERFYSALGFTAVMLAGPRFLVWNLFKLTVFPIAMRQVTSSGQMSGWPATLQSAGQYMLVVQAVLTYVATAAFAAALGELGDLVPRCHCGGTHSDPRGPDGGHQPLVCHSRHGWRGPGSPSHHAISVRRRLAAPGGDRYC